MKALAGYLSPFSTTEAPIIPVYKCENCGSLSLTDDDCQICYLLGPGRAKAAQ